MHFLTSSLDLFKVHSKTILREGEDVPEFISSHNLINLRYTDYTVDGKLRSKTERTLRKESKKKGLGINSKMTECIVVKKDSSYGVGYVLRISKLGLTKNW